ncbi:hypothetical protein SAMN02745225_02332 [Ferrithrix thermotolerans DSM 19514]|uniref:Uncharacterized protein n=1 Tax=Ferrithrix thermotolerans DSM 19514 TaxID=1121881 RepID=A0A1M4YGZ7_9ACTN|nr:hypothetical protein SAMN02745225_02332 [Ferrithrix thermotolerans DSM 19514]
MRFTFALFAMFGGVLVGFRKAGIRSVSMVRMRLNSTRSPCPFTSRLFIQTDLGGTLCVVRGSQYTIPLAPLNTKGTVLSSHRISAASVRTTLAETCNNEQLPFLKANFQGVPESVANEVERYHCYDDRKACGVDQPPVSVVYVVNTIGEHLTPASCRRR